MKIGIVGTGMLEERDKSSIICRTCIFVESFNFKKRK